MKTTLADLKATITENTTEPRTSKLLNLVDNLGDRLEKTPASTATRYHHAYDGGLVDHIREVFCIAEGLMGHAPGGLPVGGLRFPATEPSAVLIPEITSQSLLTVALLHDLGKIGDTLGNAYYIPNISEKTGKRSEAEPFKVSKEVRRFTTDSFEANALLEFADFSDGESSLAILKSQFPALLSDLSESEVNAIRFHDGGYGKAKYATGYKGKEDALAIILHAADMLSSRSSNWNNEGGI